MKPRAIVAVDVDEVCADMHGRICTILREAWKRARLCGCLPTYCGAPLPPISERIMPDDIEGWDCEQFYGPHWRDLLTEKDFYTNVTPIAGARRGIRSLTEAGYRVIYVTSCLPGTADAKQRWLLDWGFLNADNAMRDFFAVSDKALVKADVLFDDGVHNVEAFPGHAFLVNHWHNLKTPCRRKRVAGLLSALSALRTVGL